jgi:hypothetical protein
MSILILIASLSKGRGGTSAPFVRLSEMGITTDATLAQNASATGATQTAAIQNILNTYQGYEIIWDVQVKTTGLTLPYDNMKITAEAGCGAILVNGANNFLIKNGSRSLTSFTQRGITIDGGIWNQNNANQTLQANNTKGVVACFSFEGMQDLTLKNFTIYNNKGYAIHASKAYNVLVSDFVINGGSGVGSDGVHFNGGATTQTYDGKMVGTDTLTVKNGTITVGDDGIALNADDTYMDQSLPTYGYYVNSYGDIKNVTLLNNVITGGNFGIRLLSAASRIDNISISGHSGTTNGYSLLIDNYWQSPSACHGYPVKGNVGSVNVTGHNFVVNQFTAFPVNNAIISLTSNIESLIMTGVTPSANSVPTIYKGSGYTYGTVMLNGVAQ